MTGREDQPRSERENIALELAAAMRAFVTLEAQQIEDARLSGITAPLNEQIAELRKRTDDLQQRQGRARERETSAHTQLERLTKFAAAFETRLEKIERFFRSEA